MKFNLTYHHSVWRFLQGVTHVQGRLTDLLNILQVSPCAHISAHNYNERTGTA
jgi:hypothetical protein